MNNNLEQAGLNLRAARERERVAFSAAGDAAAEAWDAGMTEVEIARVLGVDRMTVRKWRGKR